MSSLANMLMADLTKSSGIITDPKAGQGDPKPKPPIAKYDPSATPTDNEPPFVETDTQASEAAGKQLKEDTKPTNPEAFAASQQAPPAKDAPAAKAAPAAKPGMLDQAKGWFNGQSPMAQGAMGAGLGAGVGALGGLMLGDKKNRLRNVLLGILLGGGVGAGGMALKQHLA